MSIMLSQPLPRKPMIGARDVGVSIRHRSVFMSNQSTRQFHVCRCLLNCIDS